MYPKHKTEVFAKARKTRMKYSDKRIQKWIADFQLIECMGQIEDILHRLEKLENAK